MFDMVEIRTKYVLKDKDETASLPTVEQLVIDLEWSSSVDLDLMAFWETKQGETGGVFSMNLGGSHGDLNRFPFLQLSGDEGVGASGGDNKETLLITKLDPSISKLRIVALNYTDAKKQNATASFKDYNGRITITNEKREAFEVPLQSPEIGTAAWIATIDNTGPVAKLKREDKVFPFSGQFIESVPGSIALTK
jgi:uncharacterized protein involved in tellurium resistance